MLTDGKGWCELRAGSDYLCLPLVLNIEIVSAQWQAGLLDWPRAQAVAMLGVVDKCLILRINQRFYHKQ